MASYSEPKRKNVLLTQEEEYRLARAWLDNKDEQARATFLKAFEPMALGWATRAARIRKDKLDAEDLAQEARIGLMAALDRFDPELGWRFNTFARHHVISQIQIHTLENIAPMRIFNTRETKMLLSKYKLIRREIEARSGGQLDEDGREEICKALQITRDQLDRFEMATMPSTSIDAGAGNFDDDAVFKPMQLASEGDSPEEQAMKGFAENDVERHLSDVFSTMDPRDEYVIRQRYLSDPISTLDTLSKELNVSRERIRQIESRALKKLGQGLIEKGIENISDILMTD